MRKKHLQEEAVYLEEVAVLEVTTQEVVIVEEVQVVQVVEVVALEAAVLAVEAHQNLILQSQAQILSHQVEHHKPNLWIKIIYLMKLR